MSSQAIEKQSIFTSKDEIARLPKGKPRNDIEVESATPAWGGLAMTILPLSLRGAKRRSNLSKKT